MVQVEEVEKNCFGKLFEKMDHFNRWVIPLFYFVCVNNMFTNNFDNEDNHSF